jgi:hypothetical protein
LENAGGVSLPLTHRILNAGVLGGGEVALRATHTSEAIPLTDVVVVTAGLVKVSGLTLDGTSEVSHPHTLGGGVAGSLGAELVVEGNTGA